MELHSDRVYWVYHVHEDALVGMLFARAAVRQGRIMFALHAGTIISPDDIVVAGILSSSDHQSSLNRGPLVSKDMRRRPESAMRLIFGIANPRSRNASATLR